jgi:hypothetical protein
MVRGLLGVRTITTSNGSTAYELIAPTAGIGVTLRKMTISLAAATASTLGLGRPAAIGVTPTSPVRLLPDRAGDPFEVDTKTAVAWGTPPTQPAAFMARISFPAVIGSTIVWEFNNGILIPAGGSLTLWNLAVNGVLDVTVEVDE